MEKRDNAVINTIVIREAIFADCPVILEFIKALARFEQLEHQVSATLQILENSLFGTPPRAFALLAEAEGKPVGFCLYFYNFSTFTGKPGIYIEDIFVSEQYRGLGIGKRFFATLAEIARLHQCSRIEWWVLDWNRKAIDFYTELGAVPMSEWTVFRITENRFAALADRTEGKSEQVENGMAG